MYVLILFTLVAGYLPGLSLKEYSNSEKLTLYVNKLDSSKTLLPYEYSYLKYCDLKSEESENIGQELSGDRPQESNYVLNMNTDATCTLLCTKPLNNYDTENFKWMIDNDYRASWVLDNLPAGEIRVKADEKCKKYNYNDGFPVGFKNNNGYFVFNHHNIEVFVHKVNEGKFNIVGFFVEPANIKSSVQNNKTVCEKANPFDYTEYDNDKCSFQYYDHENITNDITFTYSVRFITNEETKWEDRWKNYLRPPETKSSDIHYYSLLQSTAMVFLLSGMLTTILRRSILRDITSYNDSLDTEIETGWKQVRSDIFRAPKYSSLFSIAIGTGIQLLTTIYITLLFSLLNFLKPEHQGILLSTAIVFYTFMGVFAGYTSARFFKMFGGTAWQLNAIGTATFLPGLCMLIFLIINSMLKCYGSSGAVTFFDLIYLLVLWLIVSLSLTYIGAFVGSSKSVIENTCKVSRIPKPIVVSPGLNKLRLIGFLAGVLPFGSVLIEMNYIMAALWHPEKFYYFFGFLFICSVILLITSAEAAILLVYLLLSREDYRWWWLSFFVPGSSGAYLFLYSVWYCFNVLQFSQFSAYVLYFGYMFLICVGFMIVTGTIGFYASYYFIRIIYSMIKQD